jgi:hypothetical protein
LGRLITTADFAEPLWKRDSLAFLSLFGCLAALRIFLAVNRTIPFKYDSFFALQLQYVFFNEVAVKGSIPLWFPYIGTGVPATLMFVFGGSPFPSVLYPFASLLTGVNFLYIFEAGILFDEFIFLLGCFLLARRYFRNLETVIFVSAAAAFTLCFTTEVIWLLALFYLIPITIYCLDRAIRDRSARYTFLAGLFGIGSIIGTTPYLVPFQFFVILLFGLSSLVSSPSKAVAYLVRYVSSFSRRHVLAIVLLASLSAIVAFGLTDALGQIVFRKVGRDAAGLIHDPIYFLTFTPDPGYAKFYDLIDRYSNANYMTLYAGLLVVPFMVVALVKARSRGSYTFGIATLLLIMFSAGTTVSLAFFYLFPLGDSFRYIGLTASVAKLFLIFYAGFGFEAFLDILKKNSRAGVYSAERWNRLALLMPVVALTAILLLVLGLRTGWGPIYQSVAPWLNSRFLTFYQIPMSIRPAFILPSPDMIVVLGLPLLTVLSAMVLKPKWTKVMIVLLLLISVTDVFSFKVEVENGQSPPLGPAFYNLFNTYDYQFQMNRTSDPGSSARFSTVLPYTNLANSTSAEVSWATELLAYVDVYPYSLFSDYWPKPVDDLNAAFVSRANASYNDAGVFILPTNYTETYAKIVGSNFPKLGIYSNLYVLNTSLEEQELISSPSFKAGILLASSADANWNSIPKSLTEPLVWGSLNATRAQLATNQRVNNSVITVEEFSFNSLRIHVDSRSTTPTLLYYADTWNPSWEAFVNGKATPIIRTDIAYKSVVIPPGESDVLFTYGGWQDVLVMDTLVLIAIGIFVAAGYIFALEILRKR